MPTEPPIREAGQAGRATVAGDGVLQYDEEVARMAIASIEELYTNQLSSLSTADRLHLIALLAQGLAQSAMAHDEETEKRSIEEHLARAGYTGGALFKTAEEVDAYIRAERDSWER